MLDKFRRIAGIYFQDEALRCPRDTGCSAISNLNLNDRLNQKIRGMVRRLDTGICLGCLREVAGSANARRDMIGECSNPEHEQDKAGQHR